MDQDTQYYQRPSRDGDEPMELNDVLEPFDAGEADGGYGEAPDDGLYDEYDDYSDEHEAMDISSRFQVAMGVFDTISILIGVLVVLVLVAMLVSLFNWLRADILHSMVLLQSGLQ